MPPRSPLSVSGIYKITCQGNGKFYIGSSKYITTRWSTHRRELRLGIHHSPYMQRSWDKYGQDSFSIEILEECTNLLEREQHYIDTLKPGLNVNQIATSGMEGPLSEEAKKIISEKARIRRAKHFWKGKKRSIVEISEMERVCPDLLTSRLLELGWDVKKSVKTEKREMSIQVEWEGKMWYHKELSEHLGISTNLLYRKVKLGWSVQDVLDHIADKEKSMSFQEFCSFFDIPHTTAKSRFKAGKSLMEAVTGETYNGRA